ncbi:hypothetical protein ABKN59_003284 [Abortiporus biennis]
MPKISTPKQTSIKHSFTGVPNYSAGISHASSRDTVFPKMPFYKDVKQMRKKSDNPFPDDPTLGRIINGSKTQELYGHRDRFGAIVDVMMTHSIVNDFREAQEEEQKRLKPYLKAFQKAEKKLIEASIPFSGANFHFHTMAITNHPTKHRILIRQAQIAYNKLKEMEMQSNSWLAIYKEGHCDKKVNLLNHAWEMHCEWMEDAQQKARDVLWSRMRHFGRVQVCKVRWVSRISSRRSARVS